MCVTTRSASSYLGSGLFKQLPCRCNQKCRGVRNRSRSRHGQLPKHSGCGVVTLTFRALGRNHIASTSFQTIAMLCFNQTVGFPLSAPVLSWLFCVAAHATLSPQLLSYQCTARHLVPFRPSTFRYATAGVLLLRSDTPPSPELLSHRFRGGARASGNLAGAGARRTA